MDELRTYELAGKILEGSCVDGVEPHKVQQISDRIVSALLPLEEPRAVKNLIQI